MGDGWGTKDEVRGCDWYGSLECFIDWGLGWSMTFVDVGAMNGKGNVDAACHEAATIVAGQFRPRVMLEALISPFGGLQTNR